MAVYLATSNTTTKRINGVEVSQDLFNPYDNGLIFKIIFKDSLPYNTYDVSFSLPPNENVMIDWGDGSAVKNYSNNETINIDIPHTYNIHGETSFIVKLSKYIKLNEFLPDDKKYISIEIYYMPLIDNSQGLFSNHESCTNIYFLDTSKVTNMEYMFKGCRNLTTIPQLDTSQVTKMIHMFDGCSSLTSIPQLDISNVADMLEMFYGCSNIETIHMININADLDISPCTKITREAILEVINNLVTQPDPSLLNKTLTVGDTLKSRLLPEDITLANSKGWNIV